MVGTTGIFEIFCSKTNHRNLEFALLSTTAPPHQAASGATGNVVSGHLVFEKPDERAATVVTPPRSRRKHQQVYVTRACKSQHRIANYVAMIQKVKDVNKEQANPGCFDLAYESNAQHTSHQENDQQSRSLKIYNFQSRTR